MSETVTTTSEAVDAPEATFTSSAPNDAATPAAESSAGFSERYEQVLGAINSTLNQVDWSQAGLIVKVAGIFTAVIVAQILIKGLLDTVNLIPIVPGLLELLGLVVAGRWALANLTTSQKREALTSRLRSWQQEYLG
ncbi:hypothetical protein EVJ50_07920 [Synechococcus sp. RSCCF101]|uniref:CAAD domain-containing protein n=1 Tax=Synechococcus sp. RSCCF101 TaxID=2511069 RepID=UPI001248F4EB|nr:CAAD domain-containing protein [Synechococcus sp. RSCCF101]QEY32160.1 hypothetical protein EVJ50_07920 [Synechococcus sp. RSCCF101]